MGKHSRKYSRRDPYDRDYENFKESRRHRGSEARRSSDRSGEDVRMHSPRRDHRSTSRLEKKLDRLIDLLPRAILGERQNTGFDIPNRQLATMNEQAVSDEQQAGSEFAIGANQDIETYNEERGSPSTMETNEVIHVDQSGNLPLPLTNASDERAVTFATPEPVDVECDIADFKMDLMGANSNESIAGPPVHELVAKTWTPIFTSGFSKETKEALLKKYPAPQNLQLAKAPTLNMEVRQAIPLSSTKRDEYQVATQRIIEASITVQASLMSELLKPEDQWDTKRIFELASDSGRLTSHVQYHLSRTRRALITPMLTPSAKNALESSPIDKQLFGEQYMTKMKDAAAADRLVKSLTKPSTFVTKSNSPSTSKTQFRTKSAGQGNARAFVKKTFTKSRQGTKAANQTTRHRSSSHKRPAFGHV